METMKAFWRYDWTMNRVRLITLAAVAALAPWAGHVSRVGLDTGATWAVFVAAFTGICIVVPPGVLLGYVGDIGRVGAPFDFRHFSRSLPIDPGKWALAKIVSAIGLGVLVPAFLYAVMTAAVVFSLGHSVSAPNEVLMRLGLSCLAFFGVVAAGTLWSMLMAALVPFGIKSGAGVFLGAAVFFCGELLVHNVTGFRALEKAMKIALSSWASAIEAGLCLALAVAIGLVFVRFHRNRRLGQALLLALGALVAVDAARAWLWWRSGA